MEDSSSDLQSYKQGFRELLYIYHYDRSYREADSLLRKWKYAYPFYVSSSDIYPTELQDANRALTQFITLSYSAIEYLTSILLLKCLKNPTNEKRVRHAVHQNNQYANQLFWAAFTTDERNALDTISQIGNSDRINLIEEIDNDSIDIPSQKIDTFGKDRHKIAHQWSANTHVHTFERMSNRSEVSGLIDEGHSLVDILVKNVYDETLKYITAYIQKVIKNNVRTNTNSFSEDDLKSLPIIKLISMYQENMRLIDRFPLPFEAVVDRDEHELLKNTLENNYTFNMDLAESINIFPTIRGNRSIVGPSDIKLSDLEIPDRSKTNSEIRIQTNIGRSTVSTDAHRDDDFKWYAILFVDGDLIQTYPDNPFKDMPDLNPTGEMEDIQFTYTFEEEGTYEVQVGIVLEGTMSIQSTKISDTVEIVTSAEE